jgi:hypothetical protein
MKNKFGSLIKIILALHKQILFIMKKFRVRGNAHTLLKEKK